MLRSEESSEENSADCLDVCQRLGVQLTILGGYPRKVPSRILAAFPNSIINIHPALLPKYGGKGMYGTRIHQAVIAAGETYSGSTVHIVIRTRRDRLVDKGFLYKLLNNRVYIGALSSASTVTASLLSLTYGMRR